MTTPASGSRHRALFSGLLALLPVAGLLAAPVEGLPHPRTGPVTRTADTFTATVHVDNVSSGRPTLPLLVGNNTQWSNYGDNILSQDTLEFKQPMVARATQLGPTVMRYPGGALADTYQWQAGIGPLEARGQLPINGKGALQTVYFGTQEFLELCAATGAKPLITVNTVTATAKDAADWLTLTNLTGVSSDSGQRLPSVPFWEIGNEPYYLNNYSGQPFTPQQFVAQVNLIQPALKAVDPTVLTGIPLAGPGLLTSDADGVYQDFNAVVLAGLTVTPDFISVHDGYLPVGYTRDKASLYLSTMGGSQQVSRDMDAVRAQVQSRFPQRVIPFAMTEYNALYTVLPPSDHTTTTLTGALYIADLLTMLSQRTDVLMANFWSLVENITFGAITADAAARPAFQSLWALGRLEHGDILTTTVQAPTFDAPPLGYFLGQTGVPGLSALVTRGGSTTLILLINKDISRTASTSVLFTRPLQPTSITSEELYSSDYLRDYSHGGLRWTSPAAISLTQGVLQVSLKPHSLTLLTVQE